MTIKTTKFITLKSLSFTASFFAVCLLLQQSACSAAVNIPGWVYGVGSFAQNGGSVQTSVNVYDYGTYMANGLYFNGSAGLVKSLPTTVTYTVVPGATTCKDATLTGPGSITTASGTINGQIWVHVWSGVVNGVSGNWVEAQLTSNEATPVLLWATGSTWVAGSTRGSQPVKMGSLIRLPK